MGKLWRNIINYVNNFYTLQTANNLAYLAITYNLDLWFWKETQETHPPFSGCQRMKASFWWANNSLIWIFRYLLLSNLLTTYCPSCLWLTELWVGSCLDLTHLWSSSWLYHDLTSWLYHDQSLGLWIRSCFRSCSKELGGRCGIGFAMRSCIVLRGRKPKSITSLLKEASPEYVSRPRKEAQNLLHRHPRK